MFQNNVREFLKVSQLSKTNFCRGVGISATMLNCWLRGERNISTNLEIIMGSGYKVLDRSEILNILKAAM